MRPLLSLTLVCIFSIQSIAQVSTCIDKTITTSLGVGESGVLDASAKWTNGSTIKVRFLGGSQRVQEKIRQYARAWESFANIKFDFITYGDADVRIGFNSGGYWSYCGTHARRLSQSEQTMNYEGFNDYTDESELKRTILHEFGHALGLLHEHKSPLSHIQWNKPRVYAYYMQTQGWSSQKVDEQILNRYSVTMSNKEYDPRSIMHYPIYSEHTLDGYSVGWNTDLSAGDKKLIAEMYPYATTRPVQPTTGGYATATCVLKDISVTHNVIVNGKYGLEVNGSFRIDNALGKNCRFVAYFYNSDGTPLKDFDNTFKTTNGNVAVGTDCVPRYTAAEFTNVKLYLPYDQLHMKPGHHNLKLEISVWDEQRRELASGGATYFTYRNGAIFSAINNVQTFDNYLKRVTVMPKFTVENGRGSNFQVYTYFYFSDGRPVQSWNNYTRQYENIMFSNYFTPGYDNTTYNYGYYSDLFIYVPYSSFPSFPGRRTYYKYYTAIFKDGQQVATSSWTEFYLDG